MKAIFGLGNPTREYAATRHNIGFDTITRLSDDLNIKLDTKKFKGLCGFGIVGGEKIILVQPQTFMNLSGECVSALCGFFKLEAEDVIVICDDISLDPGTIRIRAKGSAGGHNGLKNIIAHLGTEEFTRIRIGVGDRKDGRDLADYVLARFDRDEEPVIAEAIKKAADAVKLWVTDGTEAAMNRFNTRKEKKPKEKAEKGPEMKGQETEKGPAESEQRTEKGPEKSGPETEDAQDT
ncbi:MAG: aminoacyl-tRNA hydrolase [Lachnospiraceae bacterium]|nr:aminoacyl-tRNA hydrolase [Lachnospiraceae bacterium]